MQYPQYGGSNELEFLGFMARRLNLSLQSLPAAVEPDAPESQRRILESLGEPVYASYKKYSKKMCFPS